MKIRKWGATLATALFVCLIMTTGVVLAGGKERTFTLQDKQFCRHLAGVSAGVQATRQNGHKLYKFYFDLDMVAEKYRIDKDQLWFLVKEVYYRTDFDTHPSQVFQEVSEKCEHYVFYSKPEVEYTI